MAAVKLVTMSTNVQRISCRKGDLLLVQLDELHTSDEAMRIRDDLTGVARECGMTVLVVAAGVTIDAIGEQAMARLGWVRRVPSEHV